MNNNQHPNTQNKLSKMEKDQSDGIFRHNDEMDLFFSFPKNSSWHLQQIKQFLTEQGVCFEKVRDRYFQKRVYRRIKWLEKKDCEKYYSFLRKSEEEINWFKGTISDHILAISEVKNIPKAFQKSLENDRNNFNLLLVEFKSAGLDLDNYREHYLQHRVLNRISKLKMSNLSAYISYVKTHPEEIHNFVGSLAINTTKFFRNKSVWAYLESQLFPFLNIQSQNETKSLTRKPIRILSAPCSSGEEPYSIAMIHEKLCSKGIVHRPLEIVALDIDIDAINKAQTALYGKSSINHLDPYYTSQFFHFECLHPKTKEKLFGLSSEITRKVKFIKYNLFESLERFGKFDVIFCRNFLIYISKEREFDVLKHLISVLNPGGFFNIGKSETIDLSLDFDLKIKDLASNMFQRLKL
ncbi:protein-glutamate O-methyltransferase CheR [Candidatus Lokiarchaeum ossiferum]|uniref:protein-glutamate O-methyltransferase CheR n=1 Tax=Candidatus Lokiarchaeum ossiferum TaxID=2951803 RepID=UPI00352D6906